MFVSQIKAQDLNISQTLEYINLKINVNKASIDENARYIWEVNNEGKLTITQYLNNEWNFSQTVYLKALDKNRIFINDENFDQEDYFYTINIKCINDRQDVIKKSKRHIRSSSIFIRIGADDRTANQLKNAIQYLISLAESKTEYKSRDIDLFDFDKKTVNYQDTIKKPIIKNKNKKIKR